MVATQHVHPRLGGLTPAQHRKGLRLVPQPRVDMLRVDRLLQPRQLPRRSPGRVTPLEQRLLEPAIEVLHAAIELRLPCRDEHGADAEAQAQPDHPRQGPRRWPPAGQFAGVVELDLGRPVQVLPALPEEGEDLVHAARAGQVKADGAVEGVLAHPDGRWAPPGRRCLYLHPHIVMYACVSFNYKSLVQLVQWNWRYSWLCNANWDEVAGYWEQWDYVQPVRRPIQPAG